MKVKLYNGIATSDKVNYNRIVVRRKERNKRLSERERVREVPLRVLRPLPSTEGMRAQVEQHVKLSTFIIRKEIALLEVRKYTFILM